MARIVLAHGILGFGAVLPKQPIQYFNGIFDLFTSLKHDVVCPEVAPLGSIAARSAALKKQIEDKWPDGKGPLYLLAHSMGGLDCRHMLATDPVMAARVRRLITIATPHYGSPVADAVLPKGLFPGLSLLGLLRPYFAGDAGALADLRTHAALQDENVKDIEYLNIGCNAAQTNPPSWLFSVTAAVGGFEDVPNDGVVSLDSASQYKPGKPGHVLYAVWPVDHGGAIGWPSGGAQLTAAAHTPPPDHLARYRALLDTLVK